RWSVPATVCGTALLSWTLGLGPLFARLFQGDAVGDLAVRLEIWSRALQVMRDFPLTGIGMGSFRSVAPALYPYVISDPEKVHHAHNLYLQIGTDLGLFGLVAFFGLVVMLMKGGLGAWSVG